MPIGPFQFERGVATSVVTAINLLAANVSSGGSINLPGAAGTWIQSVTNGVALSGTPTPAQIGAPAGSGTSTGTNTGDQTITLTGAITGSGTGTIAVSLSQTGTGSTFVMSSGPTITDPILSGNSHVVGALYPSTDAGATQANVAIRANKAAPNNANGNDGDWYFDGTSTSMRIYCKSGGNWNPIV